MKKGSIVLSPQQAKTANSVLQNVLARQNTSPDMGKNAWALYGSIYQWPNFGRYRPRYYVQQDSEQGLDSLSRELLVRWSREVTSQQGWVESAIRILAQFAVGDAYLPEYVGDNPTWGKEATDWLVEEFYPNCCVRGRAFDFQTTMFLESQIIDVDGDFLCIYGKSKSGMMPQFQIIPSHRIRSTSMNDTTYSADQPNTSLVPGTIFSDGVLYDLQGFPLGYKVVNFNNLVNTTVGNAEDMVVSAKNAMLIYDPRYFDKGRGRPTIGSAILQALSLQEIETYLMEKIKIESCVGLVEKTQSGEGPLELQQTLAALNASTNGAGIFGASPNVHGLEIIDGPTMRYVKASGGEIQTLSSTTPADQTSKYIDRLEQAVLSTLGVPSVLLLNPGEISGRISDGVGEIFNRSVKRRQKILDGHGKFIISWALANAMQQGLISSNYKENLYKSFNLTHPATFSLNKGYDDKADLDAYKAGTKSLNEIAKKRNTSAKAIMEELESETLDFLTRAQRVAKTTGVDLPIVLQSMREGMVMKPSPAATDGERP
jgi:hypothetical protein